jgi:hypothetical protein
MKRISLAFIYLLLTAGLLPVSAASAFAQTATNVNPKQMTATSDKGWPRTFTSGATSFSVYQPQIDKWQDNRVESRAAVAVTTGQSKQPTYGVIWFVARTEIDKVNRLVTMTDFVITRVNFPTHADQALAFQNLLQAQVQKTGEVIALDRLLAEMAIAEAGTLNSGYQLKNEPPQIFFSTRQAILILIDGEPVLRPVKDTDLNRVINTRALILQDESKGKFYLHLMDGWMEADRATGPWTVASSVPSDLKKALTAAAQTKQVDLLDGAGDKKASLNDTAKQNALPVIYVSLKPAELLQTQGEPQLAPVEGTGLVYVTNSENDIFIDTATQDHYVLIAGRWFRSKSMKGQWEYVAGERLSADFAKIPSTHEKASVLASVAGTPQAKEALIANSIPQTATITRSAAILTVNYDGEPQFKSIEGTTLKYAVNTSTPVIAVTANYYFAVQNGVWFVSTSPNGRWTVATTVPTVIYTIPPSSPVHNVTYVKVYGSTPETVYVGYTPGYYGTVVSSDKVVVYGTGWYFPPYIGSYWYGWGYTYGYGAGFTWSTYTGWGVAFGIGYGWSSYYYPGAWYAAAWGYYPAAWGGVAAANVYGTWGNVAYAGTRAAWANSYTGNVGYGGVYSGVNAATGTRYNGRGFTNTNVYTGTTVSGIGGAAYNPYTGRAAAGQAGAVSNAYTGNAAVGGRGVTYNPQTGVISGGAAGATYNAATGEVNAGGKGFAYNTKTDTGVAVGKNNVYAGKDGEVYRYNKSDGLQQHTSGGWSSVDRPTDTRNIQNQQAARANGQSRWENFRSSGSPRFGGEGARLGSGSPKFGSGGGPRVGRRR